MQRPPGDEPLFRIRAMRHGATEPEKRLWSVLRNRQIAGAKFRRQVWIGSYVADFLCAEARLIVEVVVTRMAIRLPKRFEPRS